MARSDELRQRIVDVAAELFAEHGYGGTKLAMVAERAGVSVRTVRRLTGGREQLFALVIATKLTSEAADRVATAAADPEATTPPLAVLIEGEDDAAGVLRLQWTPAHHVVLHRDWAPLARAEQTRASALLRLAAAIASSAGDPDALGWSSRSRAMALSLLTRDRPRYAEHLPALHVITPH